MVVLGIGTGTSKKGNDYIVLCLGLETNTRHFKGYSTDKVYIYPSSCELPSEGLDLNDDIDIYYNKRGFPIEVVKK